MVKVWHSMEPAEVLKSLSSRDGGLKDAEVKRRLDTLGFNELKEKKKASALSMLLNQFRDLMVVILVFAVIISALFGDVVEAVVILIILVLNALLGFTQEYKAEKALSALKRLAAPKAHVIRNGKKITISSRELVPGDIILLITGDKIPADARIIEGINLRLDEASLTGESTPVSKSVEKVDKDSALGDRKNMVYSGTLVTYGRGKAIVVATGKETEIGKIAGLIQAEKIDQTPLQAKLDELGKHIGIGIIGICAIIFLAGVYQGHMGIVEMFIAAVALAVAAVPEGLPAVVTITLALGLQKMVKKNVIIRRLPSVETLGSTTVICSDKTGTLTKNEMTVRQIYADFRNIDVTGEGYNPEGEFLLEGKKTDPKDKTIDLLLKAGMLCNDSSLTQENGRWSIIGDPTEGALVVLGNKAGLDMKELRNGNNEIGEIQFDAVKKRMTTIHKTADGKKIAYMKGAPEIVLELCSKVKTAKGVKKLTKKDAEKILKENTGMTQNALRVLAVAYKELDKGFDEKKYKEKDVETSLTFIGLVGMIDPPREDAKKAIQKCKDAGINVIVITGDHELTAMAIAKDMGLIESEAEGMTGKELDKISDKELRQIVKKVSIFARVSPDHKVRIVDALKANGEIVAMTGDGINDAPSLKKADIGIAMGITGTDVAKEAADAILTNEDFASIVAAVEEGRGIYDNIKKFVRSIASSNLGEVLTVFIGISVIGKLPLTAIHLLWINLVTDGLPALALAVDPKAPNIMERGPRKPDESVITKGMLSSILLIGPLIAFGSLFIFQREMGMGASLVRAQTMAFVTIIMYQMFNGFNCRSENFSLFSIGPLSNRFMVGSVLSSMLLVGAVIYVPFLQNMFGLVSLSAQDWLVATGIGATALAADEVRKLIIRKSPNRKEVFY